MAEARGFEPLVPCGTAVFKTAAFNHSATLPLRLNFCLTLYRRLSRRSGTSACSALAVAIVMALDHIYIVILYTTYR